MTYIPKGNRLYTVALSPAGTTSTTGVMQGIGGTIVPKGTGRFRITLNGGLVNSTAGDGVRINVRYGTGTPPANGDAPTGTLVSTNYVYVTSSPSAFYVWDAAKTGLVTGLTIGITYWFDCEIAAFTGGTASITQTNFLVIEL